MLLTESEAKTKWCPHVRIQFVGQAANRIGEFNFRIASAADREYFDNQQKDCNCIASACSQWRWADKAPFSGVPRTQAECDELNTRQAPRRGYCGLAGVPFL